MGISIRRSLMAVLFVLAVASLAGALSSLLSMRSLTQTLFELESDEVHHLSTLKQMSDAFAVTMVDLTHKVVDGSISMEEGRKKFSEARQVVAKVWSDVKSKELSVEEAKFVNEYEAQLAQSSPVIEALEAHMRAGEMAKIAEIRKTKLYPAIDPLTDKIDLLVQTQLRTAKEKLDAAHKVSQLGTYVQFALGALLVGFIGFGFYVVNFLVIKPLARIIATMRDLAAGTFDFELPEINHQTEIGEMARAVDIFRENAVQRARLQQAARDERERESRRQAHIDTLINRFRFSIKDVRETMDSQLSGMKSASNSLNKIAQTSAHGASAAQEASAESTANVSYVANAAGELTSASREISTQVHKAGECVNHAMNVARDADTDISNLAGLADRIGAIVDIINSIAEQTNMLALNATIEAARAGEAGRSFAVVASEVKTLAGQTAKATDEISAQVAAIQQSTNQAVQHIRTISATVSEIEERTMAIAAAVEEQEASTHEISRSITLASNGSQRVTENVLGMAQSVEKTNEEARLLRETSENLDHVAGKLTETVDDFLHRVVEDVKERRAAIRRASNQAAVVMKDGKSRQTHIVDISTTGVRIESVSDLRLSEKLTIQMPDGYNLKGRVVWIANGQAGVEADMSIPANVVEAASRSLAA